MRRAIELRELGEQSTEETARSWEFRWRGKGAKCFMAKEITREIEALFRISLDVRKGRFTTIGTARHMSQDPAACNACD